METTKGGPDDAASRNIQKDLTLRWPEWVYEIFLISYSRHKTKAIRDITFLEGRFIWKLGVMLYQMLLAYFIRNRFWMHK